MSEEIRDRPLDQISTLWSVVCRAHGGTPEAAGAAQWQLLARYGGAVRRYLLGALRDDDAVDDLFQEFSLRLMRGDLGKADPGRGRFRYFVKGVLFHLIADHHRRRGRSRQVLDHMPEPTAPEAADCGDREFLLGWREQLLKAAWVALEHVERQTGQPYYSVLRLRADRPDLSSPGMADELSAQLGRPVTAAWVRQTLHRAREKYADLLLNEVAQTLESPSADGLEEELIDLDLFVYCRAAIDRYRGGG